jgi:hypothetical protein
MTSFTDDFDVTEEFKDTTEDDENGEDTDDDDSVWVDDDGVDDNILVPIIGGIMKTSSAGKDHIFAWSGTDPDAALDCYSWDQGDPGRWTIKGSRKIKGATRMKGPPHDGMYRPAGVKYERATREMCSNYKSDVYFNGMTPSGGAKIAMKVKVYKGATRAHMIKTGMWDIFNVYDVATQGSIDILRYHSKVSKEQMTTHIENLRTSGDSYILQNLAFSGACIRASLSPEMLRKLLREVPIDASGPESYGALMRVVHSDSYPAMQKIKQQLESIKLANYPGENVELCCDDIISLSDQLDAAGAFVPDLLCTIVQTFEGTTDHRLMTWAMNRYELVAKRVKYLHSMQMGVDERDPQGYVNICHDVTAQWRSQTDSNRWTVSGGKGADKNAEPNLPAGYLAGCLPTGVTNGLSSAQVQAFTAAVLKQVGFANRGGGGGGGTVIGNCHRCGQPGHHSRHCPQNTGTQGNQGTRSQPAWKKELKSGEDPETATRMQNGKLYRYCSTCGFFIYHHSKDHAAWAARQAARDSGTAPPPPSTATDTVPVASLAGLSLGLIDDSGFTDVL